MGKITRMRAREAVTWEAPDARYRLLGVTVRMDEGVEWRVDPRGAGGTRISVRVWARFPSGLAGRARDREHTRVELRYLKELIER